MPVYHINGMTKPEEGHQAPRDEAVLEFQRLSWSDEEDFSSSSSSCSCSLCSSGSSSCILSSTSSFSSLPHSSLSSYSSLPDLEIIEEEMVDGVPSIPQSIPSSVSSSCFGDGTPEMPSQGESSNDTAEGLGSMQGAAAAEPSGQEVLNGKVAETVGFLLFKYVTQEPTTEAEILNVVCPDDPGLFSIVFPQACECLQLAFGVEMVEVDSHDHTYILVTSLGFTDAEAVCPDPSLPQSGLLLFILGIIIQEGHCASEEVIWSALSMLGMQVGEKHVIFGDPKELLTKLWVQEQYLEYRQVLGSDPPFFVFLWGPRAHAEAKTKKVLEFWLSVRSRGQDSCHSPAQPEQEEQP